MKKYLNLSFVYAILAIIVKVINIDFGKKINVYQLGLNISAIMLAVRGVLTITTDNLSNTLDASVLGIAGIGQIILGISLIMILLQIKKEA